MRRLLLALLLTGAAWAAPDWRVFPCPEFEAGFPGAFKVTPSKDNFQVTCEADGQTAVAGWARLQGGADAAAIRARVEKAGFKVLKCDDATVGGLKGLRLQLDVGEARVCQKGPLLFEAIWIGKTPPERFWTDFKVH